MAEVVIYARANCPHCHKLITRLAQLFVKLGLPPPTVHYVSPLEEPPLPENVVGIDVEGGGKILGTASTDSVRGNVPVTLVRLLFHPGNRLDLLVFGSVRDDASLEELCRNIAMLVKLYFQR